MKNSSSATRPLPTQLWHAVPLHYLPYLFYTGALCSQAELKRRGYPVRPRSTAARRDRKLRLDDFVHLSPVADTPLLRDKCGRGYPHALIAFNARLLNQPGVVLCRYNAKSWRHREDFAPVEDPEEQERVWAEWQTGKYPSLEILVPGTLPLSPEGVALYLPDTWSEGWLAGFDIAWNCTALPLRYSTPEYFPGLVAYDSEPLNRYREACRAAEQVLPPPDLPFD